ncbi:LCP family protein [Radiobacillus sp. PE A8.2]|uniref:LCP family glycopolymer transferase n=1 Tax=Radiobacillus sp. PE A8.2 TaxID=3380349 RepID=UPI00388E9767
MSDEKQKKKIRKRWILIPLAIVLGLTLAVVGYSMSIYLDAKQTVDSEMNQPVASIDHDLTKKKLKDSEPLNILLLGVDKRSGDRGRSDALMVLSLNPVNDSMQLISIPRDTRTEIVGRGFDDKINHAYAFGGIDMSINTVENLLDIDLDYYVEMNMEGLSEMVDAINGITVTNELDWVDTGYYEKGFHYAEGELQLDGPQTMGYVRMRYQDPNGDFGRTKRQRQVIEAIIDKGASVGSINKISDMIDVLGNNMATNMDFADMRNLLMNYSASRNNFTSYQMKGTGKMIDGIYYLIVSEDEVSKVHNMVKQITS